MKQYDYLIVGAGLFGAVFAQQATKAGKSCLVIDKRDHIAGNIYTENVEGINVHRYGAHIFHTNNKEVWDYVNQFAVFNRYTNSPVANYKGELYNLPFNKMCIRDSSFSEQRFEDELRDYCTRRYADWQRELEACSHHETAKEAEE